MPRRNEPPTRTCAVSREAKPVEALIRFVAGPDGEVVPDLRRRLPGRGVWVSADAASVRTAEKRRLFARGLEAAVTVAPDLAGRVEALLREAALSALSLARKAGEVVTGFAKVEAALADQPVAALIHAADAGTDGVGKLAAAARRRFGDGLPVIAAFTGAELDLALGRSNVVHAALLTGPASANLMARVRALDDFNGEGAGGRPSFEATVASAGR